MLRYDLHTHLAPDIGTPLAAIERERGGALVVDGRTVGPADLYHPDKLECYLSTAGLDRAVVSLPPPFFRQHLDAARSASWVAAANDGLLSVTASSGRLMPLAYLPLEHPELALAEYRRILDLGRFAGFAGAAGGRSASMSDPRLDPLWAALAAGGSMIMLHPGPAPDPRLGSYYLENLLGNPGETGLAAAQLVFGGVLSRHPRLRVLLVHCGGIVPAVTGRWQRGADTARPGVPDAIESPVQAVRRFYIDCLAHDQAVVDLAVTVFGEDKVVLGSDWPFPMGTRDPISLVAHRGRAFARAAAASNAEALLGMAGSSRG